MRTGAVIIAAGHKSTISRFQPMLPVGDSTVIRRIIITLKRAGIEPVVVVTGQKADEVEKHIAGLRVICLRNQDYEQTQMYYSICMGLNYRGFMRQGIHPACQISHVPSGYHTADDGFPGNGRLSCI